MELLFRCQQILENNLMCHPVCTSISVVKFSLTTLYRFGTVLYPVYPLMNSHCHCNTRIDISDKDLALEVRAQVPIKAGEEVILALEMDNFLFSTRALQGDPSG